MKKEIGPMGLPWKRFERYELHQTVLECYRQELDGILHVKSDKDEYYRLYLEAGQPRFADSTCQEVALGRVLIDLGFFTDEQYNRAVANFNSERTIAKNLLSIGLVNRGELLQAAAEQIKRILGQMVSLPCGLVRFDPKPLPPEMVRLEIPFGATYLEGVLRIGDRAWIASRFGSEFNQVYRLRRNDDQGHPTNQRILSKVDGHRDVHAIVHETGVDEFTVLKVLYANNLLGVLEEGSDPDRRWEGPLRKPRLMLNSESYVKKEAVWWPYGLVLMLLVVLGIWWGLRGATHSVKGEAPNRDLALKEAPTHKQAPILNKRDQAIEMLVNGDYDDAAQSYRADFISSSGVTIALELVCQAESVDRIVDCLQPSWWDQLLVFPKEVAGNACYWVCWGEYESELDASSAIPQIPSCLLGLDVVPTILSIGNILGGKREVGEVQEQMGSD